LAEKKPEEGDKKFTQEDLDRVVADRLKRETSKYSDYDELKAKAAKLDEAEASRKSDDQKLLERVEAAERKAAEGEELKGGGAPQENNAVETDPAKLAVNVPRF
jgi:hypothetical protein